MDKIISTIFFDGRFWTALLERLEADGTRHVGKYVFGPEPNTNDLLHFYLYIAHTVQLFQSDAPVRIRAGKSRVEQERITRKSFIEFKTMQEKELTLRQQTVRNRQRAEERDLFIKRQEKKKQKKRGH